MKYPLGSTNYPFKSNSYKTDVSIPKQTSMRIQLKNSLDSTMQVTVKIPDANSDLYVMNATTTREDGFGLVNFKKEENQSEIKFTLLKDEMTSIGLYDCSTGAQYKKFYIEAEKAFSVYGIASSLAFVFAAISSVLLL